MSQLRIERVVSLPAELTASTMYIVRSSDAALVELVLTGTDVNEVRHVISKADVQSLIASAIGQLQNILVVPDIAARDALTPTENKLVLVMDATGDPTVNEGAALYLYNFDSSEWVKVAEYESLDVSLDWANIQNGPASTPAAIDNAVSLAHTHTNKAVLDDIGDDGNGNLTYLGAPVGNALSVADW